MSAPESVDLAARREQLRLRSAQLREQISMRTGVLRPAFSTVDRVRGGVQSARHLGQNRAVLMLGAAALAGALLVRPRAAVNLGLRVWSGWQMVQRLRPVIRTVMRQVM